MLPGRYKARPGWLDAVVGVSVEEGGQSGGGGVAMSEIKEPELIDPAAQGRFGESGGDC